MLYYSLYQLTERTVVKSISEGTQILVKNATRIFYHLFSEFYGKKIPKFGPDLPPQSHLICIRFEIKKHV